ncbi:4205_t:CDS:2, partial [Entrophospora sp. SA101]
WRRPDSTSLSSATHMATCVAKKFENALAVPAKFNNIPIINPKNIDDSLINTKLINEYKGIFDISYNDIKSQWINNKILDDKLFDRVELLKVHIYDADIEGKKEERSMESVKLIDIKQQSLRSLKDYLLAIKMITNIDGLLD